MSSQYILRLSITLIFLLAACCYDIKLRRVPNHITFPMILSGIVLALLFSRERLLGIAMVITICFLFALLPGIGMGDVKLLMGMGCYLSPINVMIELALASILIVLVRFIKAPRQTWFLIGFRRMRPLHSSECEVKSKNNSVPLAPYLLIATLLIEGATILCDFV